MNHFAVYQKLAQHCKSTILQFFKKTVMKAARKLLDSNCCSNLELNQYHTPQTTFYATLFIKEYEVCF